MTRMLWNKKYLFIVLFMFSLLWFCLLKWLKFNPVSRIIQKQTGNNYREPTCSVNGRKLQSNTTEVARNISRDVSVLGDDVDYTGLNIGRLRLDTKHKGLFDCTREHERIPFSSAGSSISHKVECIGIRLPIIPYVFTVWTNFKRLMFHNNTRNGSNNEDITWQELVDLAKLGIF